MKKITDNYIVSENTLAILPARKITYDAIVLEASQTLYVRQTPLDIIKDSCLAYWSTYDGRRLAAIHHTGNKYKTPIAICPTGGIFAFPTHAPTHMDCHWIFYEHVFDMVEAEKADRKKSLVQFKGGRKIQLDVSPRSLQAQMQKTWECVYEFKRRI